MACWLRPHAAGSPASPCNVGLRPSLPASRAGPPSSVPPRCRPPPPRVLRVPVPRARPFISRVATMALWRVFLLGARGDPFSALSRSTHSHTDSSKSRPGPASFLKKASPRCGLSDTSLDTRVRTSVAGAVPGHPHVAVALSPPCHSPTSCTDSGCSPSKARLLSGDTSRLPAASVAVGAVFSG